MLIDLSYFIGGPRHIRNATLGKMLNPDAQETNAGIKAYIQMYQQPFLIEALGEESANVVSAYLSIMEEEDREPDAAYETVVEKLKEPFANYVFFNILRDSNTQATITGLVQLKCANEYVAPIRRQVSAWNDMVEQMREFSSWSKTRACKLPAISVSANLLTKINSLNL